MDQRVQAAGPRQESAKAMDTNKPNIQRNVGKAITKGVAWTLSIRLINRTIGVVSTLILARLLTPTDFGVYALAMSVYSLLELIGAFGFGTALIQNQNAEDDHYHTAWTLNLFFALISAACLFLAAPLAANFLKEPALIVVLRFMCLLFLIDGLRNIGVINFQKNMTFDREFRLGLLTKLSGFLVTVPMAFYLQSYWAMLWGLLMTSVSFTLLSYILEPFRPRFRVNKWRDLLGFSAWLQVNNLLSYFNRNIANIMLSRMAGTPAVGSLTMAKEAGQLLREMAQPINRAAFPGYAKVNHDPEGVKNVYCDVLGAVAIIGFAVAVGIYSIAHMMVPTLLGSKWVHIVPLVQWLALGTLIRVILSGANNVLVAMGWVRYVSFSVAVRLAALIVSLVYLLPNFGVMGVAYANIISVCISWLVSYYAIRKSLKLGLRRLITIFYRPATASLIMWYLVSSLFSAQSAEAAVLEQVLQLFLAVFVGAIAYFLVLWLIWVARSRPSGPELYFLRLVVKRTGYGRFLLRGRNNPGSITGVE